jgi:putative membrane protein
MYDRREWHPGHWIQLGFLTVFAVFVAAAIYFRLTAPQPMNGAAHFGWFPFGGFWIFLVLFLLLGPWRRGAWGPWGGRRAWPGPGSRLRADEAFHILRERYARGELTKDQYDAMMRDLGGGQENPRSRG